MAVPEQLEEAIARYHESLAEFIKGNPEPFKESFSHSDEVSLANPFRPAAVGWADADETMTAAAELWREGEVVSFDPVAELITPELGYVLEIERYRAKMGGAGELTPVNLRVTSIFRLEDGTWKVVHRHADPITEPRSADSVVAG
jgi:ketosteroid isomerase-like protein